jgi:hypothetical protein
MKPRLMTVLVSGLFLGLLVFCAFYAHSTANHRQMLASAQPELAWFQREFNLSPEEFDKISKLHAGYMPHCKEMCQRIDQHNERVRNMLTENRQMTPELQQALDEGARLRAECQNAMLAHFLEVSRTMKPEQGRRYLNWVYEKTFLPYYGMHSQHAAP